MRPTPQFLDIYEAPAGADTAALNRQNALVYRVVRKVLEHRDADHVDGVPEQPDRFAAADIEPSVRRRFVGTLANARQRLSKIDLQQEASYAEAKADHRKRCVADADDARSQAQWAHAQANEADDALAMAEAAAQQSTQQTAQQATPQAVHDARRRAAEATNAARKAAAHAERSAAVVPPESPFAVSDKVDGAVLTALAQYDDGRDLFDAIYDLMDKDATAGFGRRGGIDRFVAVVRRLSNQDVGAEDGQLPSRFRSAIEVLSRDAGKAGSDCVDFPDVYAAVPPGAPKAIVDKMNDTNAQNARLYRAVRHVLQKKFDYKGNIPEKPEAFKHASLDPAQHAYFVGVLGLVQADNWTDPRNGKKKPSPDDLWYPGDGGYRDLRDLENIDEAADEKVAGAPFVIDRRFVEAVVDAVKEYTESSDIFYNAFKLMRGEATSGSEATVRW